MRRLLFLLVGILSWTCGIDAQSAGKYANERHWDSDFEKVRIISYNIFNGFDWGRDRDRQARFSEWVKRQAPDILALQELCGFTERTLAELAKGWGHPYCAIVKENGYPVGITSSHPIEIKSRMTANCGHGLLHVKIKGLDLLVTHLNPSNTNIRRKEAETIKTYIKENGLTHCLLMGDMNAHSPMDADYMETHATDLRIKYGGLSSSNLLNGKFDYSTISCLMSTPLVDVCQRFVPTDKRATFPTPVLMNVSGKAEIRERTSERLDFILVSPAIDVLVSDAFIFNGSDNDYLSDHYPVGVDLCIKKQKSDQ